MRADGSVREGCREALRDRYLAVRDATERLAEPLSAEDQQLQSMPDCSPVKWHRAHTTWFYEAFVLGPRGVAPVDERWARLFNSYYEALGARHPRGERGLLSRPSAEEVGQYRRAVDRRVVEAIERCADEDLDEVERLVRLGCAHEEQHQELLLTDIKNALWCSPLRPPYRTASGGPGAGAAAGELAAGHVVFDGGLQSVGAGADVVFAFDNERPRHRVWLEPFALDRAPVSHAALCAFIEDGGYETPSLWLSDGMAWVRESGRRSPLYTEWEPGSLRVYTHDGMVEADPFAPAMHLTLYEADALCRYLGGRLPTEVEWEVASGHAATEAVNDLGTGLLVSRAPALGAAAGASRLAGMFGDVWEWTSSAYGPWPGYEAPPGAIGEYNGKFMVNQVVLRGGSCLTPPGHVRRSYRNFWPAATGFQMTGVRVARSPGA
ncbi:MAG: ergothioneine biosynthesis protein EgtB [Deltaproteobacteria bacterium]|nr:MAG: ergothioneine biosynthesis protein EgtB [Deltaproteobacteria bacterium]